MIVQTKIPKAFRFLSEPHKYKVCRGGRGSGKSHSYARQLVVNSLERKHRILCARELQNSISDSVHQLLKDVIEQMGLLDAFRITEKEIECKITGSLFKFKGLHHNINEIKSFEGVTICWVEEAQKVEEESWKLLLPTIFRTAGAELWVTFNTGYEDDAVYERFVKNPPEDCVSVLINYDQNPYFPPELEAVRLEDQRYRPQEYKNIWLGEPKGYGGKVWPQFINKAYPEGHIRVFDWELVKEKANCIQVMDPAQKYYPACIWIAVIPRNNRMRWPEDFYKWVYAEYPTFEHFGDYFYKFRKSTLYSGSLLDMAREFYVKDGFQEHDIKVQKRFIDTHFTKGAGSGNIWSNETDGLVSQFAKPENGGLVFQEPPVKFIDAAKNDVVKDLQYNTLFPMSATNEPSLFVAPWCKNFIYTMFNHRVEEDSEKESEKLKDFSDVIRICYGGLTEFTYTDPQPKVEAETEHYYDDADQAWMAA